MDKAECLKDFKAAAGVDNHLGAARFHLRQWPVASCRQSARPPACWRKMIEAVTEHHRQQGEDNLAVTRRTQLLQQPAAAVELFVVLLGA